LEDLVMKPLFGDAYRDKTVLVSGHTGFKGSWLSLWLTRLGARVIGYALPPPTTPCHFDLLDLDLVSLMGDIRDRKGLSDVFSEYRPDIVFHLAAQPLVRRSYAEPVETFDINIMGTVNVLEACRQSASVRAAVVVTSDKCYESGRIDRGYREDDPLGGYDPYSASKGCAELITSSYRRSYFHPDGHGKPHGTLLASARAGNVIGGGDWQEDRLIPDIVRSHEQRRTLLIRNPGAMRPWQHVLEPLAGYLLLGQQLLKGNRQMAGAWNFGPMGEGNITVEQVVQQFQRRKETLPYEVDRGSAHPHETGILKLDSSKARKDLGWRPVWDMERTIQKTVDWYNRYYQYGLAGSEDDLKAYVSDARDGGAVWAIP
jgi:CDP-glucose 4,6-dehydratase